MTCDTIRERLDGYLDGDLSEAEYQEVELHLAGCGSCGEEERALRRLVTRAAELPREALPTRDLWAGIASRIGPRSERRGTLLTLAATWQWLGGAPALAATAAVILAVSVLLLRQTRSPGEAVPALAMAPVAGVDEAVTAVVASLGAQPAALTTAVEEYEQAARGLLRGMAERRSALPPETLRVVDKNLQIIDEALGQIRQALREAPGDPALTRMLGATYRKKLGILRQITGLKA